MNLLSCDNDTQALKRYQRRTFQIAGIYLVIVLACSFGTKHLPHGSAWLYVLGVLPAVPVIVMLASMGRYLMEETDEFQRMQMVLSILVGAAALLSLTIVSDFLRVMTPTPALPPFVGFVVFFAAMAIARYVLRARNRVRDDE